MFILNIFFLYIQKFNIDVELLILLNSRITLVVDFFVDFFILAKVKRYLFI